MNREWWQNLDQIMIVAVASLEDLPDQGREAARRWIEKTELPKSRKRALLNATKNPKTSMRCFVPRASEQQIAECQNEMLAELRVRGPAVWAAYWGAPGNGDRLWVTGVPRAEGGLSALYAHIRAESEFKTTNAAMDAKQHPRRPVSQPPDNSLSDGSETMAAAAQNYPDAAKDAEGKFTISEPAKAEQVGGKFEDRRAMVNAYIEEVFATTGRRITRTDIWKSTGYKARTEFERWERGKPGKVNKTANERFTKILVEKPHLRSHPK